MRRDDPMDELEWAFLDRLMAEHEISPERIAQLQAATRAFLDRVADFLDNPPRGAVFPTSRGGRWPAGSAWPPKTCRAPGALPSRDRGGRHRQPRHP